MPHEKIIYNILHIQNWFAKLHYLCFNVCMEIKISDTLTNKSIKEIAQKHLKMSTRMLNRLKFNGGLLVNGEVKTTNYVLQLYDILTIGIDDENDFSTVVPTDGQLDIIFEDDWLMVVNKPPFLPVHPSKGNFENSLSNYVKHYLRQKGISSLPRIATRLDANTSGLVLIALNQLCASNLSNQLIDQKIQKEYLCITDGVIDPACGTVEQPIERQANSIIKREVNGSGKYALTHYHTLQAFEKHSLVSVVPITGRTHQIRVHMAFLGYPLLGDGIYGSDSCLIERQALHMHKITFLHPKTNATLHLSAPLPTDMKDFLSLGI